MAQKDLKPVRTKEEARERGRMGGLASAAARQEKKTIRKSLEMLLERVQEGEDLTGAEAVAAALFCKARGGDLKAIEVLRDTVGEKPSTALSGKVDSTLSGGVSVTWQK